MILSLAGGLRMIGRLTVDGIWRLGAASRFMSIVLSRSATTFRRFRLLIDEIYFAGALSLIIIVVSGLFVGLVLGLQGYETLKRYGSAEAIGTLVALSLVRELGPVVAALLFASRAGSAITAKIGIMKSTEQLSAMEMMAVDPYSRVIAPMFWGARQNRLPGRSLRRSNRATCPSHSHRSSFAARTTYRVGSGRGVTNS